LIILSGLDLSVSTSPKEAKEAASIGWIDICRFAIISGFHG
jgi:hypothetical protein